MLDICLYQDILDLLKCECLLKVWVYVDGIDISIYIILKINYMVLKILILSSEVIENCIVRNCVK